MMVEYKISTEDEEKFRKVDEIVNRLLENCDESEFLGFRCPFCGNQLNIFVHPRLDSFFLACALDTTHFSRTKEVNNPPEWWKTRVNRGWLG